MTLISFRKELSELIPAGKYPAKIEEVKTVYNKATKEEIFVIIFNINGKIIRKQFKLWSIKFNDRLKSQKDLQKLANIIISPSFKFTDYEGNISLDTSIFQNKEVGIIIEHFTNDKGENIQFIKSFYPLGTPDAPLSMSAYIEDTIEI